MTENQRTLLQREMSARLPYSLKGTVEVLVFNGEYDMIDGSAEYGDTPIDVVLVSIDNDTGRIEVDYIDEKNPYYDLEYHEFTVEDFKPYLRPMSDMTEEEARFLDTASKVLERSCQTKSLPAMAKMSTAFANMCYERHLDQSGLIGLGLATPVTKDKNPYDKQHSRF